MTTIGISLLLMTMSLASCGGSSAESSDDTNAAGTSASSEARTIEINGGDALMWGDGAVGVVLSHGAVYDAQSWKEPALRLANEGMTIIALEDTSAESVSAAVTFLEKHGAESIVIIGASAGGSGVSAVATAMKEQIDGLILLSSTGDVERMGTYPKLFVASEGEGLAGNAEEMADAAPGNENRALILEGDAHAQAIFSTDQGDRLTEEIIRFIKEANAG